MIQDYTVAKLDKNCDFKKILAPIVSLAHFWPLGAETDSKVAPKASVNDI